MKIVITRKDGGVLIMALVDQAAKAYAFAPEQLDAIVQAEINQWTASVRDSVVSWRVMGDDRIPFDRTFRNAWTDTSAAPTVDVDMPKARDIHRDNLRMEREDLLDKLDVDYMKADEIGDAATKATIVAQKQVLRDIPENPAIEAADTPEELKALTLEVLTKK